MKKLESLNSENFGKISKETMRSTRGGTTTSGYEYSWQGVKKTCASDKTEWRDQRLYATFYDAKGNVMDEGFV
jgi:hypothetical protein